MQSKASGFASRSPTRERCIRGALARWGSWDTALARASRQRTCARFSLCRFAFGCLFGVVVVVVVASALTRCSQISQVSTVGHGEKSAYTVALSTTGELWFWGTASQIWTSETPVRIEAIDKAKFSAVCAGNVGIVAVGSNAGETYFMPLLAGRRDSKPPLAPVMEMERVRASSCVNTSTNFYILGCNGRIYSMLAKADSNRTWSGGLSSRGVCGSVCVRFCQFTRAV